MDKKVILILLVAVIIVIVGVVSAYFLTQPQYETYENEYFSVNVTKGAADFTPNITENNSITTYTYTNGDKQDDGYIRISILSVNSSGSLYKLVASTAIGKVEDDWAPYLMNDKDHDIDGKVYEITNKSTGNVVYSCIIKTHESDGVFIMLTADNIDTLKVLVDTFKLKQLTVDTNSNETNNNTAAPTNTTQKSNEENSSRSVEKDSSGIGGNPYDDENYVGEDDNNYYFSDSSST